MSAKQSVKRPARQATKSTKPRKTGASPAVATFPPDGNGMKPLRAGTMNARVVALAAEGKWTLDQIGEKLGMTAQYARAWLSQTRRR